METFFGEDYTPHGDTHLRTIKQYTPEMIQTGFDRSIDLVLADRGFESLQVYQTLDNLGVTYLLPKIERSPETTYIDRMEQEDTDVAVEQATVKARRGSHECRVLFVLGRTDDTQPFITNKQITAENAEAWVTHYAYRWWIEAEYRTIKQEFLARTSSTDHTLRFYYFVFGILMYNVWRLTDVLLKATVSQELTNAPPVLTAGELADWVAIHLQLGAG